jgi:beta-glucanase (GH16 family)
VAGDGAAGGSSMPQSTGAPHDAGSNADAPSGLKDATGTGGTGGQQTGTSATGGNSLIPDAGTTVIDAPVGDSSIAGNSGGAAAGGATGGKVSSTSAPRDGAVGGTPSAPVDAVVDAASTPDVYVSPDTAKPDAVDTSPWHLVWSDEFDGDANAGVVASRWNVSTWDPGTVNSEKQKYTARPQNVFHDGDGHLVLRALNDSYQVGATTYPYTSGRIQTDGKFEFKFGRIEISAKLPAGQGSFPGMVLMGTRGSWPQCGEIGLVEQRGQDKTSLYCSTYSGSQSDISQKITFPDTTSLSAQFHTYALEWTSDQMVFFVDDAEVARRTFSASSPFSNGNNDFYLILNVALGGTMGGDIDDTAFSRMEMDMVLDYVRVYSLSPAR